MKNYIIIYSEKTSSVSITHLNVVILQAYTHQPPPTWPPTLLLRAKDSVQTHRVCATGQILHRWPPSHNPFRPASCPISVSSHRQMGLCWQGSIVRGQRGDDVTAGCGPSNRQRSVGKIALSARGHRAGHKRGLWWVKQCPMTSTDPIRTAGVADREKEGLGKKPWGFEECHKAEWRIRWRDSNAIKNTRWGVVILLLVAVKKRPPVIQTQWILPGAKCTVQTAESQHFVSFFRRLWLLFYWHPDVLASLQGFETATPGRRMGSCSLLSIHITT